MFNHIYGSPFPPINPRVRYKTALERAGFEVNYNGQQQANYGRPPSSLKTMERKNASTGSLNELVEPPKRSQSRVNSLPENRGLAGQIGGPKPGSSKPGSPATQRPRPPPTMPMSPSTAPPNAISPRPSNVVSTSAMSPRPSNVTSRRPSNAVPPKSASRRPSNPIPPNGFHSNPTSSRPPNPMSPTELPSNPTSSRPSNPMSPTGFPPNPTSSRPSNPMSPTGFPPNPVSSRPSYPMSPSGFSPNPMSSRPSNATTSNAMSPQRIPPGAFATAGRQALPEVDPIEKSFMLLTQNDTTSTIEVSGNTSKSSSQEFQRDTDSSHVSEHSRPLAKELPPFMEKNDGLEETIRSDSESVNFEPEPELQVSLGERPTSAVKPLNVDKLAVDHRTRPSSSVSQNPELTAANEQVERLIAQLDDVSLSKNAQLNSRSAVLPPPLQTSKTKNSSAYLSGFPQGPLIEQTVTPDDTVSEVGSTLNGDTPLFYNFQKSVSREFPQEESMHIESSRLMLKPSDVGPRSPDPVLDPTPDLEFKYPPGTGPCRACGEEPTGKRIYSKKDNELSGQWHRDCFRCLTCNVRFNKSVPCYILDDKPYCRQHYHEENSSICHTCREFIEGECVENDRMERFHIDCLVCFLCREPITSDYFIFNSELPLCGNHDMDSLPSELLENDSSMSKRRTRLINFST
ncbi:ZYBA0S16-00826g1_1 [Zygosaccharomyces bailii CLIB 213]|uniref:ZYBA0S16-00826g1_1 n=1 Tax=Zygosaccharomyces bailii (strain CLIB 213 / ATCC 58445 / CBS 680 / BCRC 21525 / NBRC 1098 / NCYC 1416 / NRRL Y-2227) TaxID=1333698 RepID=A0A8J2TCJ8_ZYGB2|nr:ZYBA0S16-00826g1_1 [Zygosaccharomyces bailii CLIB 213]